MMERILVGVFLAALIIPTAVAGNQEDLSDMTDLPGGDPPRDVDTCFNELAALERVFNKSIEDKALSEKDVDEANRRLDLADEYCFQGSYKEANKQMIAVRKMVVEK